MSILDVQERTLPCPSPGLPVQGFPRPTRPWKNPLQLRGNGQFL